MQSFRKNIKSNHDNDDKIRDKKLQYNIRGEAGKISALSSGNTLINMNISLTKKYYLWYNKLNLYILFSERSRGKKQEPHNL